MNFFKDLFAGAMGDLKRRPAGNIPALDVLRSLAILLVFGGHFAGQFNASSRVLAYPVFYWSWVGVDLFFVLSGILIGTQLWKELRRTGNIRIGKFLLRRGFRIWPLYFALVVFLLIEAVTIHRPVNDLWSDAIFLSNYFHHQVGGGWSLSTEEQFYIVAPVCLVLFSRLLKTRHCWVIPALGMVILPVLRAVEIHSSTLNDYDLRQKLYSPIHTHSDGLVIGLLIAWAIVFVPDRVASMRVRGAICCLMVLAGIALYKTNPIVFNFTSLALIFGAAAFGGMAIRSTPALLDWHGFYLISRLSYGVYLNHFGILRRLGDAFKDYCPKDGGPVFWMWGLISFLVCMAFATLTFQLFEWPFLRLRARWLKSTTRGLEEAKDAELSASRAAWGD